MISQLFKSLVKKYRRKKQRLNDINMQKPAIIDESAVFKYHSKIHIGRYCRIGYECHINGEGGIEIGDGSILAPRVVILSSSHNYKTGTLLPYSLDDVKAKVIIGKGCWIGWGAFIGPGITIGDGAVVAMGSVVTKNVDTGKIVGGNPAKIINERSADIDIAGMIANENFFLKEVLEKSLAREGRNPNIKEKLVE